jgi:hypothetical protein
VPGAPALAFDESAFATRRDDHLGMTLAEKRSTLEARLVQGAELYAGLWTQMPDRTGAGGVEVDDPNYERVPISRWLTRVQEDGVSVRRNAARATLWPVFEDPQVIVGWGLWTAANDGTMRFFDHTRTPGRVRTPVAYTVPAGSRFGIGSGRNGIGLVL